MPRHITEYIIYRWRYSIGYVLVGLLVTALLVGAALYIPGGLREEEIASAVSSNQFSLRTFDPVAVIDLPYKILQRVSFMLFGITTLSIKLPSVLLGLLSLVGIILLLRHWFRTNVAVISALIVITTSQFIFSSQDGTPFITYILLSTWTLLLALNVSRQTSRRSLWKFLLIATLALSLYTPLSLYIILALASATLLHPHLRYIVGELSRRKLFFGGLVGLILLTPLIMALITKPEIGLTLLGIPSTWPDLKANGLQLIEMHFGFIFMGAEDSTQPVYTLPTLLLVLLGLFHLFKTRHTARSYIIVSWMVLLVPIILINPTKTLITFAPVMLLIAAGIDELLRRWYSLFPKNPYARVAGLLPITLLVGGMAFTGVERFFYVYRYSPPVATIFSKDLSLLDTELGDNDGQRMALVVTEKEVPFYQAVASRRDNVTVVSPESALPSDQLYIVTRDAFYERAMGDTEPAKIITNGRNSEADRLYLYKTAQE